LNHLWGALNLAVNRNPLKTREITPGDQSNVCVGTRCSLGSGPFFVEFDSGVGH